MGQDLDQYAIFISIKGEHVQVKIDSVLRKNICSFPDFMLCKS